MKKLLLLILLLSLGFTGLSFADDEDYILDKKIQISYVDCRPILFFQNNIMTVASVQMNEILNEIHPEQLDLVLSYVLPEDNERVANGEQPNFSELIQVRTISNDCQGVPYSLFEEAVAQEISILLKAEGALESAQVAIAKQEAKLSSEYEVAEDKTIRVFMPHGPFIKEKNAFASSIIDFKHQTINGQIVETARLTTTLLIFIHDRLLNVAFYSNYSQSSDLVLHESKVKKWYKAFYYDGNNPEYEGFQELCSPDCQALEKAGLGREEKKTGSKDFLDRLKTYKEKTIIISLGQYLDKEKAGSPGTKSFDDKKAEWIDKHQGRFCEHMRINGESSTITYLLNDCDSFDKDKTKEIEALFNFEVPSRIKGSIIEALSNQPVSLWDLGELKLQMKIDEYLLDTDSSVRPSWTGININQSIGLSFQLGLPPYGYLQGNEVTKGKDTEYVCDILRQHFSNKFLRWNGSDNKNATYRILGGLFNPNSTEKQRVNIGELLLADSTITFYDSIQPNKVVCEFNSLGEFKFDFYNVIKLDKLR